MKKSRILILTALILLTVLALSSCKTGNTEDTQSEVVYYTVTFRTNGSEVEPIRVVRDGLASRPQDPTREGYIFDCWSFEGEEWDFALDKVTSDITLTAQWIDAATVYSYNTTEGGISITGIKRQFEIMRVPNVISGLTVVGIGDDVFSDISSTIVTRITVADTVKTIGNNTFKNCSDIEIEVDGALTSIGEAAFLGCNKLSSVKLAEGLTTIPPQAFTGCSSLTEMNIPKSVTLIDENAFEDCTSMKRVILHNTLEKIGDGAFIGCDSLATVYFYGSKTELDAIEIANGNTELKTAELYSYSAERPSGTGNFWYFDAKGKITIW